MGMDKRPKAFRGGRFRSVLKARASEQIIKTYDGQEWCVWIRIHQRKLMVFTAPARDIARAAKRHSR